MGDLNIIGYNSTILPPCVSAFGEVMNFGPKQNSALSERNNGALGSAHLGDRTMATGVAHWIERGKQYLENPQLLTLLVVLDLAAYFAGLIFWYGSVMTDPATPMWAWPFIPDCPLFGLLGGLGLLMVIARSRWSEPAQKQGQRLMW